KQVIRSPVVLVPLDDPFPSPLASGVFDEDAAHRLGVRSFPTRRSSDLIAGPVHRYTIGRIQSRAGGRAPVSGKSWDKVPRDYVQNSIRCDLHNDAVVRVSNEHVAE